MQAGILSGTATSAETLDLLLFDVVPLPHGVAMEGNIFASVVPRGQTVPSISRDLKLPTQLNHGLCLLRPESSIAFSGC